MSVGVGDLVTTLGMNVAPLQASCNTATGLFQRLSMSTASTMGRIKAGFASLGGLGLGGILAGGGLVYGMKRAIELSEESMLAEKKLQAVLTSTGGAAGFSAEQLKAHAAALQKVTNFDDEATIAGMAVMATFTSIRGDVFTGAIEAAQNLSAVMGQDLQSSVVLIGKALNNPLKGMTALQRVGVAFTNEQKEQIKNLVTQGDLVGAQRIILNELKTEFGGAARAMASPMQQARNAIGDLGERIGNIVKPAFAAMLTTAATAMGTAVSMVEALWARFSGVRQTIMELWAEFRATPIGAAFATAVPLVLVFGAALLALSPIIPSLTAAFGVMWAVVTGPIGWIVAGIVGIGAALVYVVGEGDTMAEKFQSVIQYVGEGVDMLAFAFRNFGNLAKLAVVDLVLMAVQTFPQMEGPIQKVCEVFIGSWALAKTFFTNGIQNMIGGLLEVWNFAKAVGAGIAASWKAIGNEDSAGLAAAFAAGGVGGLAGTLMGSGKGGKAIDAFGSEFMATLAAQPDVKISGDTLTGAYQGAVDDFKSKINVAGGFNKFLEDQKGALEKGIGENEAQFQQRQWEAEKANMAKPPQIGVPPAIGALVADKAGKAAKDTVPEFPKALEMKSDEAWKKIVDSMFTQNQDTDQAALETAENTRRSADALETIADQEPEEIGIS
jgi:hypothetical protein